MIKTTTATRAIANDIFGRYAVDRYHGEPNDRIEGDSMYCGGCGQLKATKTYNRLIGMMIWKKVQCPCEAKMVEEHMKEEAKAEREAFLSRLRDDYSAEEFTQCLGRRYRDVRFTDEFYSSADRSEDFKKVLSALKRFVDNFEKVAEGNYGWWLWSENRGNGKTSLASCVRNGLLDKGVSCVVISVSDLHSLSRASDQSFFRRCMGCRCLIIDDIGLDKLSDWESETFHKVVNHRYLSEGLVTCYTSNFPMESMKDVNVKVATISRMDEVTPRVFQLTGGSLRVR